MTLLRVLIRAKATFQARTLHTILTEGRDMTDHNDNRALIERLRTRKTAGGFTNPEPGVLELTEADDPLTTEAADALTAAQAKIEALEEALEACQIIDEVVREGHTNLGDMVLHFMTAVEPARRALASEDHT